MTNEDPEVTQEDVIEAARHPGKFGDHILRLAVKKFQELSPEAQELYLEELKRKASQ